LTYADEAELSYKPRINKFYEFAKFYCKPRNTVRESFRLKHPLCVIYADFELSLSV